MTLVERCIGLDVPEEWARALEHVPHAFAHTWGSCRAMQITSGFHTYLYHLKDGAASVVCPLAERPVDGNADLVTPYGFSGFAASGPCPDFARRWTRFVREHGYVCGYIGLNPLFRSATDLGFEEPPAYNSVYVIDLTRSEADLYAALNTSRKQQINAWSATGAPIIADRKPLVAFFLQTYPDFVRRIGASRTYEFTADTLRSLLTLENVLLVGAGTAGAVQAVTAVGYTPHVADYLFNVSVPEGRHLATVLLWDVVRRLKTLRVPVLNLGGGVRPGDGVAQFKERFGARQLPLRSLKQVYAPELYAAFCRRVGADPTDTGGYFPAYRRS